MRRIKVSVEVFVKRPEVMILGIKHVSLFYAGLLRQPLITVPNRDVFNCIYPQIIYIICHFGYRDQTFKFNDTPLKGSDFWPFKKIIEY